MHIGTREISPDHPPYIIAELGVNHDGSPARALELVRLAAEAGADAIKLQLFEADRLMSKAARLAAYQRASGERDPMEMLRRLELSIDDMKPCVDLAHELDIHAIVSVFSVELVPVAERLPWDAYKTASPDIINKPLLEALAATGKPLIMSTGASTMEEVERAVAWLRPIHDRLAVLQCVSCYPTSFDQAELGGIRALASAFPTLSIGYSDHTPDDATGLEAVNHGARLLEKHLTHSRQAAGPDHRASLDATAFSVYVNTARLGSQMRSLITPDLPLELRSAMELVNEPPPGWTPTKRVLPIEHDVRTVSRQSLTTTRPLRAGHTLTRDDLTIKRPGTGLSPSELDATMGRVLVRSVEGDMPLRPEDLASR
jgi:N-acetylneuraminate synthase/N,N'-diacetyllegionaminate synthase